MLRIIYENSPLLEFNGPVNVDPTLETIVSGSESNYFQVDDRQYGRNVLLMYSEDTVSLKPRTGGISSSVRVQDLTLETFGPPLTLEIAAGEFVQPAENVEDDSSTSPAPRHFNKQGVIYRLEGPSIPGSFCFVKRPQGYVTLPNNAVIVEQDVTNVAPSDHSTPIDNDLSHFVGSVFIINNGAKCFAVGESGMWRVYVGVYASKSIPPSEARSWTYVTSRFVGRVGKVDIGRNGNIPVGLSFAPESFMQTTSLDSSAGGSASIDDRVQYLGAEEVRPFNCGGFQLNVPYDVDLIKALKQAFQVSTIHEQSSDSAPVRFETWKVGLNDRGYALVKNERYMYIEEGLIAQDSTLRYEDPIDGDSIIIRDREYGRYVALHGVAYNHQRTDQSYYAPNQPVLVIHGADGLPLLVVAASRFGVQLDGISSYAAISVNDIDTFDRRAFLQYATAELQQELEAAGRPDHEVEAAVREHLQSEMQALRQENSDLISRLERAGRPDDEVSAELQIRIQTLTGEIATLTEQLKSAGRPDEEVEAQWRERVAELSARAVPSDQLEELASILHTKKDVSLQDEIAAVRQLEKRVTEAGSGSCGDYSPLLEYLNLKFGVRPVGEYAVALRKYITDNDKQIMKLQAELTQAGKPDHEVTLNVLDTIVDAILVQDALATLSEAARRDPRQLALEINTTLAELAGRNSDVIESLRKEIRELKKAQQQPSDVRSGSPLSHLLTLATGMLIGNKVLKW